jgi:hypothetical protein
MAEQLSDGGRPWARATQLLIAVIFVVTASVGIAMALRMAKSQAMRRPILICLASGVVLPILVFVLTRKAP